MDVSPGMVPPVRNQLRRPRPAKWKVRALLRALATVFIEDPARLNDSRHVTRGAGADAGVV